MPVMKTDRQRVVVLAAMIVIAALIAYFRFGRKPSKVTATTPPAETVAQVGTTDIDGLLARAERSNPKKPEKYPALKRNLFVPGGRLAGLGDSADAVPISDAGIPLRVSSIMVGAGGSLATINGALLSEGQSVGGYSIDKITREFVHLRRGSRTFILTPGR